MFLVGDLTQCQLENMDKAELPFFSNHIFLKSVVDQTASDDLDLQEKVIDHLYTLLDIKKLSTLFI